MEIRDVVLVFGAEFNGVRGFGRNWDRGEHVKKLYKSINLGEREGESCGGHEKRGRRAKEA